MSDSKPDLQVNPEGVSPNQMKKATLLFCHPPDATDSVRELTAALASDYELILSEPTTVEKFQELSEKADLIWFEDVTDFLVNLSGRPGLLEEKRTILRLTDNEPQQKTLTAMAWDKIDHLVTAGDSLANIMKNRRPNLESMISHFHRIDQGVKPAPLNVDSGAQSIKIAHFGLIDMDSALPSWLKHYKSITTYFPEMILYLGWKKNDPLYQLGLEQRIQEWGLQDKVRIEGRIDSYSDWLADKKFLLMETGALNPPLWLLTGMSGGGRPLLFGDPLPGTFSLPGRRFSSEDELRKLIESDDPAQGEAARDYVRKNHSFEAMLEKTKKLLDLALTLETARTQLRQGLLDPAYDLLFPIIEKDISNKEALNYLGLLTFRKGDLDGATDFFHTILRQDPYYKKALVNFALLFRAANVIGKIEPLIKTALERFPGDEELSALLDEAELDFEEHSVSLGELPKKRKSQIAPAWKGQTSWFSNPGKKSSIILGWIKANSVRRQGIIFSSRNRIPYPGATGLLLPTLAAAGEDRLLKSYTSWLKEVQNPDGSFAGPETGGGVAFDAGRIIQGLSAIPEMTPQLELVMRRACDWVLRRFSYTDPRSPNPDYGGSPGELNPWASQAVRLTILSGVVQAGSRLNEKKYLEFTANNLESLISELNILNPAAQDAFSFAVVLAMDALFDLGAVDAAAKGMGIFSERMWDSGGVPAFPGSTWICTPGQALAAVVWLKLGENQRAKKCITFLDFLLNPSGGLMGSYGVGATYFPSEEISWPLKYYLDSLELVSDQQQGPIDEDWS